MNYIILALLIIHPPLEPQGKRVRPQEPTVVLRVPSERVADADLERALAGVVGAQWSAVDRYQYNRIDLNGDGQPETLVRLQSKETCAAGSQIFCRTYVLQSNQGTYRVVADISFAAPVMVSNDRTQGWNDLVVWLDARRNVPTWGVLKFNGTTYPRVEDNVILTWRAVVASYFSDAVIRASPGVRRDGVNIHGRVVDESGQPLSGVLVRGGPNNGLMRPDLKTDVDGMFSIDVDEALLRFSHEGYRPKTQTLKRSGEGARIELQPTDDLWRPPYCPAETPSLRGFTMGFSVPPGTRIERGSDVDYGIASLRFGKARLALGFGPTWSWGMPAGIFLKDVVELTERDIRFADDPDALVAEYRGTRSDGTRFRWIGKVAETIEYDHVTKDEADYFDRIIDTLCWIRPTPPPRRNP